MAEHTEDNSDSGQETSERKEADLGRDKGDPAKLEALAKIDTRTIEEILLGRLAFRSGVQYIWDATSIAALKRCEQEYQYSLVEGWSQKGISSAPELAFGLAFHKAMEIWYKTGDLKLALEACDAFPFEPKDNYRTKETLYRSIVWYIDNYENDVYEVITLPNGAVAAELTFKVDVTPDLVFSGHLDTLRRLKYDGSIRPFDYKTTAKPMNEWFWRKFERSTQVFNYTFGSQVAYEVPADGLVIDGVQLQVNATLFQRKPFQIQNVEEWLHDTTQLITETQDKIATGTWAPKRNEVHCAFCRFFDVCSAHHSLRKEILNHQFTQREPWDPGRNR